MFHANGARPAPGSPWPAASPAHRQRSTTPRRAGPPAMVRPASHPPWSHTRAAPATPTPRPRLLRPQGPADLSSPPPLRRRFARIAPREVHGVAILLVTALIKARPAPGAGAVTGRGPACLIAKTARATIVARAVC